MKKTLLPLTALVASMAAFAGQLVETAAFGIDLLVGGTSVDNVYFTESDSYTDGFDNLYDARKFAAGSDTLMWSVVGDDTLSVVARPNLVGTFFTIQANAASSYQLSIATDVAKEGLVLLDHATNLRYDLVDGAVIDFTQTAHTRIDNRFEIILGYYVRDIPAGEWGTICYPEFITDTVGAKIYEFVHKTATEVAVDPVDLPLDSGKAYVYQATANAQKFIYADYTKAAKAPYSNKGLMGTFSEIVVSEGAPYVIIGESLVPAKPATVPAFRAYVPALDSIPDPTGAPARAGRRMFAIKNEPAGVVNVNATCMPGVHKFVNNGEFIIMKEGRKYNAQGLEL